MKKAQIQSAETIMVLIVLSIIIIFGLIIASNYESGEIQQESKEREQLSALAIASQLGNLPELRCTVRQTAIERCIDLYKAKSFSNYLQLDSSYKIERFGNTNISIRIINPTYTEEIIVIAVANNQDLQGKSLVTVPIILNDPITQLNHFALLEVTTIS